MWSNLTSCLWSENVWMLGADERQWVCCRPTSLKLGKEMFNLALWCTLMLVLPLYLCAVVLATPTMGHCVSWSSTLLFSSLSVLVLIELGQVYHLTWQHYWGFWPHLLCCASGEHLSVFFENDICQCRFNINKHHFCIFIQDHDQNKAYAVRSKQFCTQAIL